MSAVGDRSEFKIQDGKIYRWMEGRSYYDVDWGMCYERGYYYVVDSGNDRIEILDKDFGYVDQLHLPDVKFSPLSPFKYSASSSVGHSFLLLNLNQLIISKTLCHYSMSLFYMRFLFL